MKIVEGETPKLLTNFEVYEAVKNTNNRNRGQKRDPILAAMLKNTDRYFKNQESIAAASPENLAKVNEICKNYKLTKAETLQLINVRPTDELHLVMVIEELDVRLSKDQQVSLLEEIGAVMGIPTLMDDDE